MPYKNKDTQRNYNSQWQLEKYHRRRAAAIALLGGQCVVCGTTDDLQLDHIDPDTKNFSIGKLWSVSENKYNEELAKCQLLCFKHHIEKSVAEKKHKPV